MCSRKLEAGGFVISQHSLQHFIFERGRIDCAVICDRVLSESRRRNDRSSNLSALIRTVTEALLVFLEASVFSLT